MINEDKVYEAIRKRIQGLREKHPETGKKTTQQVLANAVGLKRATLTNIELGNQRAPVSVIYKICEFFNVPLDYVLPAISDVSTKALVTNKSTGVDDIKRSLPKGVAAAIEKARY